MSNKPDSFSKDLLGDIIWPKKILVKARQAVVAYGYVSGGDEAILAGDFDHWAVIQVACYAQCDSIDALPRKIPRLTPKTIEQKLSALTNQVETTLNKTLKELDLWK